MHSACIKITDHNKCSLGLFGHFFLPLWRFLAFVAVLFFFYFFYFLCCKLFYTHHHHWISFGTSLNEPSRIHLQHIHTITNTKPKPTTSLEVTTGKVIAQPTCWLHLLVFFPITDYHNCHFIGS